MVKVTEPKVWPSDVNAILFEATVEWMGSSTASHVGQGQKQAKQPKGLGQQMHG